MDSKILKALGIDPALIFLFLLVLIVILFVLYFGRMDTADVFRGGDN